MSETVIKHEMIEHRIEIIYKSYRDLLCIYAEKFLVNREDAEDIVSDVFLKLLETRYQIQEVDSLSFIYRNVRNACLDFIKHKHVMQEYVHNVINYPDLFIDDAHPLSQIISKETVDKIERAINTLPSRCRKIFILARLEGLTYKEIAEELGITYNTVNTQISIAVKKLRQTLINEDTLKSNDIK